jgi:RNA polymerase-binding transcription factor DksA
MDDKSAKERLEQERQRLLSLEEGVRERSGLDSSQSEADGELSRYDQHGADVGTTTFERTSALSVIEQLEADIEAIDAAMERLSQGTYGRCEVCGREIDDERLAQRPSARFCIEHRQELDGDGAGRGYQIDQSLGPEQ